MMNTVVGSAIGGLVAGAVALGAAAVNAPVSGSGLRTGSDERRVCDDGGQHRAVQQRRAVQCQPYEEAVLRRAFVNGREVTDVTCITRSSAYAAAGAMRSRSTHAAGRPCYRYGRHRAHGRSCGPAPSPQPARERVMTARRETKRSWGKTAMIIGGSIGAGAGIGGLIGGKKGALIGAAVGGGAATIYESTKR